ncbi:MAG TPA: cytochrome c3 family protein [Gemmatales bacterium]|nr:cytochrome c3 family protein [Gemmatales bacterium]
MTETSPAPAAEKPLFFFPKWFNNAWKIILPVALTGPVVFLVLAWFGFNHQSTHVGYQPHQPVNYSHEIHAGKLGIDCRYCHTDVEKSGQANIPPTETCMACHAKVAIGKGSLELIRESWNKNKPIEWVKVHRLPDFVYFNHSAHVNRGVGCVSCHGRVDQMEVVKHEKPLSMAWCLECHRNPEPNLRPLDQITSMTWKPSDSGNEDALSLGKTLRNQLKLNPSTDCSTCHR